jgi:putative Mg2+ transporter-C (MgtC) family protein
MATHYLIFFGQILLSTLLGGLIGSQREHIGKAAGSRTYALVSMGSTLFTMLSESSFGLGSATVAAQIITGIGFIGAGSIIHKNSGGVEGLTTAAGLWAMAAIGMAVGVGWYIQAILGSLLVLVIFMIDSSRFLEK